MNAVGKNIVVLGSTGSIGCNALEIVEAMPGRFNVVGLSAHSQFDQLARQAREFQPRWIAATDGEAGRNHDWPNLGETELVCGIESLGRLICQPEIDLVISAIVGVAGLQSNWDALTAGKTVALANKETLVVGGQLVLDQARTCGGTIIPIDSEHSAVLQAMRAGQKNEIERVLLTASGGPFRERSAEELQYVSVAETLDHPTWEMGQKITIDSATMMNKALEIVEARWLFEIDPQQISVVIHPESIVHSLVEFRDGSVMAQLSPPDMKLPIQFAMTFPERLPGPAKRMDWTEIHQLNFYPPDWQKFPALKLGFDVAAQGGTSGAVLNAANEAAVAAFLEGRIGFTEIVHACQEILDRHPFNPHPSIDDIFTADRWAREELNKWIST